MKCRVCSEPAVAEITQHNMALCQPCYLNWFPDYTRKTIDKFAMLDPAERVLVAVSGGKDSQALWRVLVALGYRADGMVIDLGIGDDGQAAAAGEGYSAESTDYVRRLASELDRPLWVVDLREAIGRTVPDVRRGSRPVCSACGVVKRYVMNRVAWEGGYDCVATGHNLDDEVAALFGNVLAWDTYYLSRQHPVSPQRGDRLMKKVKPFCYFTERETAMYALLSGTPYYHEECPNAVGATTIANKELINRIETDARGTKRRFFDGFLRQRHRFETGEDEIRLACCERCEMPSPVELCSFCRLVGEASLARPGGLAAFRPEGAPPPRARRPVEAPI